MADAKTPKKMTQTVNADGSVTFAWPSIGESETIKLDDFPRNVLDGFALLGMRTKGRNYTTPDADEKEATPADMLRKFRAGIAQLKAGIWRVTASGGEKAPASTVILEAALIYRKMKAQKTATGSSAGWEGMDTGDTLDSIRPMIEEMQAAITNPDAVEAARAKAEAEGKPQEDVAAAMDSAAVTQFDQLKGAKLFQLALQEARDARAAARKRALQAQVDAE